MSRLGGLAPARPTSGMPGERERTPPIVLNVVTSTYRWSSHVTVLCTALVIYNAVVVLDDACVIANELRSNEHTHSRDIVPHSRDVYIFLI